MTERFKMIAVPSDALIWDTTMDHGRLIVSYPPRLGPYEAEELEEMIGLVMRGVRRRANPPQRRQMIWSDIDAPAAGKAFQPMGSAEAQSAAANSNPVVKEKDDE